MANLCVENDTSSFFDAPEEISSEIDSESDDSEACSSELQQVDNDMFNSLHYDFWNLNVKSIDERRDAFIRKTGFELDRCQTAREGPDDDDSTTFINNVMYSLHKKETVTSNDRKTRANEDDPGNSWGSLNYAASNEEDQSGSERLQYNSTSESEFDESKVAIKREGARRRLNTRSDVPTSESEFDESKVEIKREGARRRLNTRSDVPTSESEFDESKVDINREGLRRKRNSIDRFRKSFGSFDRASMETRKQEFKEGWFKRLSFRASNMFNKEKEIKEMFHHHKLLGSKKQKIRVSSHKKWGKELSSLYQKQEISAHKGSILAMKFSREGNYLATGGEDGTLNVWEVVEDEKITEFDLVSFNAVSACLKFSVNGIPNMGCFLKFKEGGNAMDKLKNSSDSASNGIMIPRKIFRIIEKPLHEFQGHEGDILDISWSKTEHLISSSVDKTVRLWKVGYSRCLRVFPHNDYVTCAQFNPMDGDFFISGSIDGKVRIWDVLRCQVVDWINIKEIVTAICYRPDGKGGIVGSMAGSCFFFDIADNQRGAIIHVQGKKMLTCKRITGFEFSPSNTNEVVVSSADNLVRVLRGTDVICKLRESIPMIDRGSQIYASFTADGKHIISATDDSNVYVWNHTTNTRIPKGTKNVWSSESFFSHNALIAVPWHGNTSMSELPSTARRPSTGRHIQGSSDSIDYQTSQDEASEDEPRSSSTVVLPVMTGADYEFLRNVCESILNGSHMWGIVIVTGGKDGLIRTYHNYGLPVRFPTGKSLRSTLSFSNIRNRSKDNRSSLKSSISLGR